MSRFMNLTTEMENPQSYLLDQLTDKRATQSSMAITYAFIMAQEGNGADWPKLNAAIVERWSQVGLNQIKKMAWKHLADWAERDNHPQAKEFRRMV